MTFGRGWAELRSRSGTLSQLTGEEVGVSYAFYHICFTLTCFYFLHGFYPSLHFCIYVTVSKRGRQLGSPTPPQTHTHMLSPSVQALSLATHPLYTYVLESRKGLNLGCLLPVTGVIIKLPLTYKTHLLSIPKVIKSKT